MRFEEKTVGDVVVLTVTGEVSLTGEGDVHLRDKVANLLNDGRLRLVLDLAGVTYIDSAGLGQLVHVQTSANAAGASLKLAGPSARFRHLLTVAKIASLFDIHDDNESALASFAVP